MTRRPTHAELYQVAYGGIKKVPFAGEPWLDNLEQAMLRVHEENPSKGRGDLFPAAWDRNKRTLDDIMRELTEQMVLESRGVDCSGETAVQFQRLGTLLRAVRPHLQPSDLMKIPDPDTAQSYDVFCAELENAPHRELAEHKTIRALERDTASIAGRYAARGNGAGISGRQ